MCQLNFGSLSTYGLVDSGADMSLIDEKLFARLNPDNVLYHFDYKNQTNPVGITGHTLDITGTCILKFKLGKKEYIFKFSICKNSSKPLLLGYYFFKVYQAHLDFENDCLHIGRETVRLCEKSVLNSPRKCYFVECARPQTIRPHSAVTIEARVTTQLPEGSHIITPVHDLPFMHENPKLTLVNSVISHKTRRVPLLFMNDSSESIKFSRKQILATTETVNSQEVNTISDCEAKTESDKRQFSILDIKDKLNIGISSKTQKDKLFEVLQKFENIHAEKDSDLTTTDLVEATIDTGDSLPIRQRPYKIPFSQRELVKTQIQTMLDAGVCSIATYRVLQMWTYV